MDEAIEVVFSGGPVNGKWAVIKDAPVYYFSIVPEFDWSDLKSEDKTIIIQPKIIKAAYRRTKEYDEWCHKIFEFEGLDDPG